MLLRVSIRFSRLMFSCCSTNTERKVIIMAIWHPRLLKTAFAVAAITTAQFATAENVVKDGQFTESGVTSHFKTYTQGQTFGAWTVIEDSVDVKATYFQAPPGGGNSVDLSGSTSGRIEQTVVGIHRN